MQDLVNHLRVPLGGPAELDIRDTADRVGLEDKAAGKARLAELVAELQLLQPRLWAEDRRSVLLVLQGMDAGGKDGTIRGVLGKLNPQGVKTHGFRKPSGSELDHDYLWRVHAVTPARGEIGVFNRSHYEDVVTVACLGIKPREVAMARTEHINAFEKMLTDEGTTIVKVFLHLSKEEQRERLQARVDTPEKHWKFNMGDLDVRAKWDDFQATYAQAIEATSTPHAPWHVVPADRKWARNVAVATLLVDALRRMDPQPPEPDRALEGLVIE